jgi:hypothetical protein
MRFCIVKFANVHLLSVGAIFGAIVSSLWLILIVVFGSIAIIRLGVSPLINAGVWLSVCVLYWLLWNRMIALVERARNPLQKVFSEIESTLNTSI